MAWELMGHALSPVLGGVSYIPAIKAQPAPVVLPKGHAPVPPTSKAGIDAAIKSLDKEAWVKTPTSDRCKLLDKCMWNFVDKAETVAKLSEQAKGSYGQGLGEELTAMFPVVLAFKEYALSLKANGQRCPLSIRHIPETDQFVAKVFPSGLLSTLLPGNVGEVWMQPGKPASQGELYRKKAEGVVGKGGISAVLGAGNQFPVVVLDILHKLLVDDEVVVCKMSPVNEYLGAVFEEALAPLVDRKALSFIYGGREVGEYLVAHPLVDSIHLTGSEDTCNTVVWGSPTAQRIGTPPIGKEVTAELGNVTPYIIVPGPWSDADIKFHVAGVVSGLIQNASHNCIAAEILVLDASWPLRDKFMAELRAQLDACPQRCAYYPGSAAKFEAFKKHFAGCTVLELGVAPPTTEGASCTPSPFLLVENLSPESAQTRRENWCTVLQQVSLPGSAGDPAAFLQQALAFANDKCWGSLAVAVWAHPKTQAELGPAWGRFLAQLRYGCITVNAPTAVGFCFTGLPWGAAPGNTLSNVESGVGYVHNTWMFDFPSKGVFHGAWHPQPRPMYFTDNFAVAQMLPCLLRVAALLDNPLYAFPPLLWLTAAAVRG